MTTPTVKRWPPTEPPRAACGLRRSEVGDGLHVGLILNLDQRPPFVLHMAWHQREHVVELPERAHWWVVVPNLDADEQKELAQHARVARERLKDHRLPFGLCAQGARLTPRGEVKLGGANGLNCVTFVQMLFRAANLTLMHEPGPDDLTEERSAEDRAAQERLVDALQPDDPDQAARLRMEIGAPRVRPEEVAAASGMAPRPVSFAQAARAGVKVRQTVVGRRG